MKVRSSLKNLKTRDRNNKLIKRKGKLYVINKKNPRMKARQGQSDLLMEYIAILAFILGLPFTYTQLEVKKIENKYPPLGYFCLLYTSPSPRDRTRSRMPSSA